MHIVQFSAAGSGPLIDSLCDYLRAGLAKGQGAIVVAGADTRAELRGLLGEQGGRYLELDAVEALHGLCRDGEPDRERFDATIGRALREMLRRPGVRGVRAYGEMAGDLWGAGRRESALALERLWDEAIAAYGFDLFCAYPVDVFAPDFDVANVDGILCGHGAVEPATGDDAAFDRVLARAMDEVLGARAEQLRPLMRPNFRPSWPHLPHTEARILWLRNNLRPEAAERVLARARELFRSSAA